MTAQTCFVSACISDRKVAETSRLKAQLTDVDAALPELRAHCGYSSELMVQGMGPIPAAKQKRYATRPTYGWVIGFEH
jgi:hypothetical protein